MAARGLNPGRPWDWDHRRIVVAALAVTVVLGALSDLLFAAALQFRPEWFTDPAQLVTGGETSATLLTWAALTDLLGYYLPTLVVTFGLLVDVAVRSVWQLLDGIFIAAWLIGTGLLVWAEQPAFARLSIALGALFLVSAGANVSGVGLARDALLAVIFGLWFAWDVWLAVLVWRRRPPMLDQAA